MAKRRNKYHQGYFTPKNKEKYAGSSGKIIWRSSWELTCMKFFDENPNILLWSSESIKINYLDPTTNKWRTYYPDFVVKYKKNGQIITEVVEVKPLSQTSKNFAKSKSDKEACILNEAKWKYAQKWCDNNSINFRILTEKDIYL